jgi:hypothetical protein
MILYREHEGRVCLYGQVETRSHVPLNGRIGLIPGICQS